MESLKFALVAYGITIVFAMIIACFIPALAWVIKKTESGSRRRKPSTSPSPRPTR